VVKTPEQSCHTLSRCTLVAKPRDRKTYECEQLNSFGLMFRRASRVIGLPGVICFTIDAGVHYGLDLGRRPSDCVSPPATVRPACLRACLSLPERPAPRFLSTPQLSSYPRPLQFRLFTTAQLRRKRSPFCLSGATAGMPPPSADDADRFFGDSESRQRNRAERCSCHTGPALCNGSSAAFF